MPLNVKFFYSIRIVKCRFLQDAIKDVEQDDVEAADFVLTGLLRKEEKPKWKKSHLKNPVVIENVTSEKAFRKLLNMNPELYDKTEWEVFEVFFNDILEIPVQHTNKYVNWDKNNLHFTVANDEMVTFIGILFLSGYNQRTYETDYWSKNPDLECLIVASAMSQTRFQHRKSYLHAADNENLSETKMAKIESFYQILNENF